MRLRTTAIALATLILALILPSLASASVASQFRVAIGSSALFPDAMQAAQRNSYVVLQSWETQRAIQLKIDNPSLVVLVYQDLSAMTEGTGPGGLSSSGVNFAEANTAHPEWFLKNASGSRIAEWGYPNVWMADIGNPEYQQQWTSNVIKLLDNGPWDGVMMDDTNTTARYHTEPSSLVKYPTDAAYQSAVRSMLAYAGPKIQAAGKLAIPNIGSWTEYPKVAKEWLQFVSGGLEEMFAKWSTTPGEGYLSAGEWQTQIEEIQTTEQMGKRFLAITQAEPSDTQAIRYGWASVLLAANGNTSFSASENYSEEMWANEYEIPVGEPVSGPTEIQGGAWKRTFADGIVVVNPTTASVKVSFGGSYSGSGLVNATGATLGPHSAVILTGEGSTKSGSGSEAGTSGSEAGSTNGPGTPETSATTGGSTTQAPETGTQGGATSETPGGSPASTPVETADPFSPPVSTPPVSTPVSTPPVSTPPVSTPVSTPPVSTPPVSTPSESAHGGSAGSKPKSKSKSGSKVKAGSKARTRSAAVRKVAAECPRSAVGTTRSNHSTKRRAARCARQSRVAARAGTKTGARRR